jgi:hypothetical protein
MFLNISGTLNGATGMSDIEGKAARVSGDGVRATTEFQMEEANSGFPAFLSEHEFGNSFTKGNKENNVSVPKTSSLPLLTSVQKKSFV